MFAPVNNSVIFTEAGTESEYSIQLWSLTDHEPRIVHSYRGHAGEVVDFAWRADSPGHSIVAWSKDLRLSIWPVSRAHGKAEAQRAAISARKARPAQIGAGDESSEVSATWEIEQVLSKYSHSVVVISEEQSRLEWVLGVGVGSYLEYYAIRVR